jgi:hypothetical protein
MPPSIFVVSSSASQVMQHMITRSTRARRGAAFCRIFAFFGG